MYLCHIDDINFIQSSNVGDWLTIKAQVNRVFSDSLEVGIRVESQSFAQGTEEYEPFQATQYLVLTGLRKNQTH